MIVLIGMYLTAIVLANLSSAYFGPSASVVNAFLFIGLDLTSRDKLHELWHGKRLWIKMFALIAAGSLLSWFISRNAGRIAIASMISFGVAGVCDAIVYHLLRDKAKLVKINGSNGLSALVDSITFPTLAFGSFMPLIVLGQFAAKVFGGFLWSLVLRKK